MNVRELYLTARGLQGLAATERESSASAPIRRRLWLWRHGFLTRSDDVYDLEENTVRDYVSDYQRYIRTKKINGTWSVSLSNKLLFHWMMHPYDDSRMTVYGLIRDGAFHDIDGPSSVRELADGGRTVSPETDDDDLATDTDDAGVATTDTDGAFEGTATTQNAAQRVVDRLEDEGKLVLKWVNGGGGNNVLLCSRIENGYRVNGSHHTPAAFRSRVADLDEYLVCEYVEQGSFSAERYPETPNTIRLVTMYDEAAGEPFIATAIHRIGTAASAPMDNFTQGGLSAKIDLETGELGPGAQPPGDGDVDWHSVHPDTGAQIDGAQIPGWETIRERVLEMAETCSVVPYIGWDIIVTGDGGEFTAIEANSYPGLKSIQVHGPLLSDDRVRQFYERHGVC